MRQILLIICGVILAISLIIGLFALNQANQEQLELASRLQSRSQILAESLSESIEPSYNIRATSTMRRLIDKFTSSERLAGLGVFDNFGVAVATSKNMPVPDDDTLVATVMDSDEARGEFVRHAGSTYYVHVTPLHENGRVVGALAVAQNAAYIEESISNVWHDNLNRWFFQILIFAIAIFILIRWVFYRAIKRMVASLQAARKGHFGTDAVPGSSLFEPLAGEISKVMRSLRQARHAASEEARMRLEKIDSPWTAERLKEFIRMYLKNRPIFVVSNREPYVHTKTEDGIKWSIPAGGAVTALESVMEACGGMWIAYGGGDADRAVVDADDKIAVPPDEPKYTLKRVWLTPKEVNGYYKGVSNEALWPLCHMAHVRPLFRAEDWREYRKVNGLFAKTILREIRNIEQPIILVQDYHFALLPELIKKSRPDAQVSLFWHIPWPSAEQFSICPWRKELLQGMLGADLIGFHTQQYCNNFIDTVGKEIESRIDYEQYSIYRNEYRTLIRPFPISIAFPGGAETHEEPRESALDILGIRSRHLVLGVDRLDYTKGILERFKGIEFLLDTYPEYKGNLTMLQIAAPTRETVEKYKEYAAQVTGEAERINKKFGTKEWRPIVLEKRNYSHDELINLYQLANVCLVTSLHDGMNLVAKEFVAARSNESGVLVLSQFAGASRDLKGAILINPYSAEETSSALYAALTMSKSEQHHRMKSMRASVRDYNIYRWSAELIKTLSQLK